MQGKVVSGPSCSFLSIAAVFVVACILYLIWGRRNWEVFSWCSLQCTQFPISASLFWESMHHLDLKVFGNFARYLFFFFSTRIVVVGQSQQTSDRLATQWKPRNDLQTSWNRINLLEAIRYLTCCNSTCNAVKLHTGTLPVRSCRSTASASQVHGLPVQVY